MGDLGTAVLGISAGCTLSLCQFSFVVLMPVAPLPPGFFMHFKGILKTTTNPTPLISVELCIAVTGCISSLRSRK